MRTASIQRTTNETCISLELNLDGTGKSEIHTGVGFLDHMLTLFARHGDFDQRGGHRHLSGPGLYPGPG